MKETFYNFLTLSAFENLLIYDDKITLSREEINNFIECLKEKIKKYLRALAKGNIKREKSVTLFLKDALEFTAEDKSKLFNEFAQKNSDIISIENGLLCLKDDVTVDDLEDLILIQSMQDSNSDYDLQEVFSIADDFASEVEPLQAIHAEKTIKDICDFFQLEQSLEEVYMNYSTDREIQAIGIAQNFIAKKLNKINKLTYGGLMSYTTLLYNIITYFDSFEELDLVSIELQDRDSFYKGNDFIDLFMNDECHQAIFSENVLSWCRLKLYLEAMENSRSDERPIEDEEMPMEENEIDENYQDEFDDEEPNTEDDDDDFKKATTLRYIFYLKYIYTLLNFKEKYSCDDNDIEFIKRRLIFILDSKETCLFIPNRLSKYIDYVNSIKINPDDMYNYYCVSHIFLIDILRYGNDEFLGRKMFYVKTYYDLTHDIRIERILDKFKNTEMGNKLYRAIIENNLKDFKDGLEIPFRKMSDQNI